VILKKQTMASFSKRPCRWQWTHSSS